jgi:hypothetical protein
VSTTRRKEIKKSFSFRLFVSALNAMALAVGSSLAEFEAKKLSAQIGHKI